MQIRSEGTLTLATNLMDVARRLIEGPQHRHETVTVAIGPAKYEPVALRLETATPTPPAHLDVWAHRFSVSNITSMLPSFMVNRNPDHMCGVDVPALNRVGVA